MKSILEVKNLKKYFSLGKQVVKAIDDVSFEVKEGEFLGIVGESGSGKSTLGRTIIKIHNQTSGKILFNGIEIDDKNKYKKNKKKLTRELQIIFQDSTSCLNQRLNAYNIISEPLRIRGEKKDVIEAKVKETIKSVGLLESDLKKYPSEFSGGQRQRIGIARALISNPKFIIADEPIASLDVSMQAQIVNLFKNLKKEKKVGCIFIAHDLMMVKYISDKTAVMYKGKIVEIGDTEEIYNNPIHPYTKLLLNSRMVINDGISKLKVEKPYNEEDEKFNFKNSKMQRIRENHFVLKV